MILVIGWSPDTPGAPTVTLYEVQQGVGIQRAIWQVLNTLAALLADNPEITYMVLVDGEEAGRFNE